MHEQHAPVSARIVYTSLAVKFMHTKYVSAVRCVLLIDSKGVHITILGHIVHEWIAMRVHHVLQQFSLKHLRPLVQLTLLLFD